MKALLFNYRCGECNTVTKAPGLSDMGYGEFIMFNRTGSSVYLNSFQDSIFGEFETLFTEIRKNFNEINEKNVANIFQTIFSITCDPSPDGSRYSITEFPLCKKCGSKKMASWGPAKPCEFTGDMKSPVHEEWSRLSAAEKRQKVEEAIERFLVDKDFLNKKG